MLTLPAFSVGFSSWEAGLAANGVIAVAYLCISYLVYSGLIRSRQLRTNRLGIATGAIFMTCALHHGAHVEHLLTDPAFRSAWHWHMVALDVFGAAVAITYLSLRKSYTVLLRTPVMFQDEVREASDARARSTLDRIAEAVLLVSADGAIEYANPKAIAAFASLAPDAHRSAVDPDGRPVPVDALPPARATRTGEEASDEEIGLPGADGELRWLRISTRTTEAPGPPYAVVVSFTDVTEQRRVASRLDASELRYRTVIEALHEGVILQDGRERVVAFNRRAPELLGLDPGQLDGRRTIDPRWETIREDGSAWPREEHPVSRVLATGRQQLDELMGIRLPGGEVRWLLLSSRPILEDGRCTGAVSSFVDVTQRREREREVVEAEERFRATFEAAPIGICVSDLGGRLTQVNAAFASLIGASAAELVGTSEDALTHPDDVEHDLTGTSDLLAGRRLSVRIEKRLLHAMGHTIWTQVDRSAVRDADGRPRWILTQVQDVTERRRHEAQLQHLADHDALTGLLNRRGLDRELQRHLDHASRYGLSGALLMLDLDNFKYVNDKLGHKAGDELIVRVADLMRSRLRKTDIVARLGGDEFAVLLPTGGAREAEGVARSLLDALREQPPVPGASALRMTASIGIALCDIPGLTADEQLVNADLAMYDAKEDGRDRYARYASDRHEQPKARARMTWLDRVRNALDHGGLCLLAQPIVDARTEAVLMHELLLRMRAESGELVPPGAFLHIAERFDIIADIDLWVVDRAAQALGQARQEGRALRVSVNVSTRSIPGGRLLEGIEAGLERWDADPADLVVELTETAAMEQVQHARTFARGIRELGAGIAIDDFGAGFGAFHYLKHLPFDYLKIDGEFVTNAPVSRPDELVVEAVTRLAHGLGRKVIAEHCSDAHLQAFLRDKGVDLLQGYHVGRPQPLEELLVEVV